MEIHGLQILFQIINFGVVFGAILFLLYKPIMKLLDERRQKVEAGERAAAESLKEKEEIEALKKKAKLAADREGAKVIEKAEEQAKELKATLTKQAKDEVKALKDKEMAKWEDEKKAMREQMEKQVSELAIAVAAKVLGAEVDKKAHAKLIDTSIKELEKSL